MKCGSTADFFPPVPLNGGYDWRLYIVCPEKLFHLTFLFSCMAQYSTAFSVYPWIPKYPTAPPSVSTSSPVALVRFIVITFTLSNWPSDEQF
jgi:hypothetical protein